MKKHATKHWAVWVVMCLFVGGLGGVYLFQTNSVDAAATNVIGLQLRDAQCNSGTGTARYASDVNKWTSWAGDDDNYDPDCIRIHLGNTIPKDVDIRIGIQARDVNTPCGFLWLSKCGDGGGTVRYSNWVASSTGSYFNQWTPWAGDADMWDADQWRFIVETRPNYGYTVSDFKFGIQTGDMTAWAGGCTDQSSPVRYTASSTAGASWSQWAIDTYDGENFNCVRINLIATSTMNDPIADLTGTTTVAAGNSVNVPWTVDYIHPTTGCTLTGRNGGGTIVDPSYAINANGAGSKTSIAITEPVTYTLFCNGNKGGTTAQDVITITPYAGAPPAISFTMNPSSGLSAGDTSVATIAVTNAASCTLVGKDLSGNTIDPGYTFVPPPPSAVGPSPTPTTTTIYLTSGTSWTVPSNWNSANNTIEVIGGGGGGKNGTNIAGYGGGGGGAYSKISNLTLTPGASVTYSVGAGGANTGTAGGDTYFNGSSCSASSVCAKGGGAGALTTGGTGGQASQGIGTVKYDGGNGGNSGGGTGSGRGGGGGGGAAGPHGAGAQGGTGAAVAGGSGGGGGGANGGAVGGNAPSGSSSGAGGNNRLGSGGGASVSSGNGNPGTNGGGGSGGDGATEPGRTGGAGSRDPVWSSSYGPGSGGGGGGGASSEDSGAGGGGGTYGGGGGGAGGTGNGGNVGGAGGQGLVVITYSYVAPAGVTLTSGTSWVVPQDWNSSNNTIHVIGGGGGGGGASNGRGGGGGGAYSKITNATLTPGQTVTIAVGGAGGVAGGDTYLCSSTSNCASISDSAVVVGAKGGSPGSGGSGGSGGQSASGFPAGASCTVGASNMRCSGGNGASGTGLGGAGGGGAAGPQGAGRSGGSSNRDEGGGGGGHGGGSNGGSANSAGSCMLGCGGPGGNNYQGSGGGSYGNGGPGGSGSNGGGGGGGDDDVSSARGGAGGHGSDIATGVGSGGGGGGGGQDDGDNDGGNGGRYGGGGGGDGSGGSGTPGTGGAGVIYIVYTPAAGTADNTEAKTSEHVINQTTDFTVTCSPFYGGSDVSVTRRVTLSACMLDGVPIANGGSANFYSATVPPAGQTCSSIQGVRGCTNGQLTGDTAYRYASCTDQSNVIITANGQFPSTSVRRGGSVAIEWDGGDPDTEGLSCTISSSDGSLSSNEVEGGRAVTVTQKTVYTARCTLGGNTRQASVTVNILPTIIEI
jgi:hypothetical protein